MSTVTPVGRRVGMVPRADLLPVELLRQAAVRATRRIVVLLILLALVIVAAGFMGVTLLRTQSQAALAAAQQRTTELQAQQAEFVEIRALQRMSREAAELTAIPLATRLDWGDILDGVISRLPASAYVMSISFVADSPTTTVEQPAGPYTWPRIGIIELGLHATELEELNQWLDDMRIRPEYSDVDMLTVQETDGWSATATLSLSPLLTAVPLDEEADS